MDLSAQRDVYMEDGLDRADLAADPFGQFERWFADAERAGLWEPTSMALATVDARGEPSVRYVLLKAVDSRGFVFYTNYRSVKAQALDHTGRAALVFGWLELRRQVRVSGGVERVTADESDAYFAQRPRGSQLGAWASPQSEVVADRAELQRRYDEVEQRFGDGDIPRPPHWGGYRIVPEQVEFWQGRPNRFHDRLRYRREGQGWRVDRLAP